MYNQKYLKYKQKYLDLKNKKMNLASVQIGGLSLKVNEYTFRNFQEPTCGDITGTCNFVTIFNLRTGIAQIDTFILRSYEKYFNDTKEKIGKLKENNLLLQQINTTIGDSITDDKYESLKILLTKFKCTITNKTDIKNDINICNTKNIKEISDITQGVDLKTQQDLANLIYNKITTYINTGDTPLNSSLDKGSPEINVFTYSPDTFEEILKSLITTRKLRPGTLNKIGMSSDTGGHSLLLYISPTNEKPTLIELQKTSMSTDSEKMELNEGYTKIILYLNKFKAKTINFLFGGWEINRNNIRHLHNMELETDEYIYDRELATDTLGRVSSIEGVPIRGTMFFNNTENTENQLLIFKGITERDHIYKFTNTKKKDIEVNVETLINSDKLYNPTDKFRPILIKKWNKQNPYNKYRTDSDFLIKLEPKISDTDTKLKFIIKYNEHILQVRYSPIPISKLKSYIQL
tara:strand:+ start:600 stop:1985 length:1386 start_codon:yes stop_codon:yes gene_type:complete